MCTKATTAVAAALVIVGILIIAPTKTTDDKPEPPDTIQASASMPDSRAESIDGYFAARSMPLAGYGKKFAEEAYRNGIDWRLLPAIAVRESSGGKQACGHNPFGWNSCRTDFASTEEAIGYVAWNLGGNNPRTRAYYSGDTKAKLQSYNGTVNPRYPAEVLSIMDQIGRP